MRPLGPAALSPSGGGSQCLPVGGAKAVGQQQVGQFPRSPMAAMRGYPGAGGSPGTGTSSTRGSGRSTPDGGQQWAQIGGGRVARPLNQTSGATGAAAAWRYPGGPNSQRGTLTGTPGGGFSSPTATSPREALIDSGGALNASGEDNLKSSGGLSNSAGASEQAASLREVGGSATSSRGASIDRRTSAAAAAVVGDAAAMAAPAGAGGRVPRTSRPSGTFSGQAGASSSFDTQLQAMRAALEQSMTALQSGPRLSLPQTGGAQGSQAGLELAAALLAATNLLNPGQAQSQDAPAASAPPAASLRNARSASPGPPTRSVTLPVGGSGSSSASASGLPGAGRPAAPSAQSSRQGAAGPELGPLANKVGIQQEVFTALCMLQRNIEQQQETNSALLANLTAQWEQRFAALEQAVNNGLTIATTTATSMNERSTKFLRLGEVLESALDRIVDDGKDWASLSQSANKAQREVERLLQELNDEKKERRQGLADVARQAESQVAALRERVESMITGMALRGQSPTGTPGSTGGWTPKDGAHFERLQGEVGRLQRDLAEECTERRQLARELQLAVSDSAQMREMIDGTQDQLLRQSRDLNSTRDEVRQVAGEVARLWNSEILSGNALRNELRHEFHNRLDSFGRELRGGELPSGGGIAAVPSAPSGSLAAKDGGLFAEAADAMRRGIANDINEAMRFDDKNKAAAAAAGKDNRRTPLLARRPATIPEENAVAGCAGTTSPGTAPGDQKGVFQGYNLSSLLALGRSSDSA